MLFKAASSLDTPNTLKQSALFGVRDISITSSGSLRSSHSIPAIVN